MWKPKDVSFSSIMLLEIFRQSIVWFATLHDSAITWVFWLIYGTGFVEFDQNTRNKGHGLCCTTIHQHTKTRLHAISCTKEVSWCSIIPIFARFGSMWLLAISETKIGDESKAFRQNCSATGFDLNFDGHSKEWLSGVLPTASRLVLTHNWFILNKKYCTLKINILYFVPCQLCFSLDRL